jgi:hypothetical protein
MRPWTWQEASILIVGASIAVVAAAFIGIKLWNRRQWSRRPLLRSRSDGMRVN